MVEVVEHLNRLFLFAYCAIFAKCFYFGHVKEHLLPRTNSAPFLFGNLSIILNSLFGNDDFRAKTKDKWLNLATNIIHRWLCCAIKNALLSDLQKSLR